MMKKTKEIHKALKRRKFINAEINDIKEAIDRLAKIVNDFEKEKKILNFELYSWEQFIKNKCHDKVLFTNRG